MNTDIICLVRYKGEDTQTQVCIPKLNNRRSEYTVRDILFFLRKSQKQIHHDILPAIIIYTETEIYHIWCKHNKIHHETGPAWITYNKESIMEIRRFCNGKQHHLHKPAYIQYTYTKKHGLCKKIEEWYHKGKLHRDHDLPAIIVYGKYIEELRIRGSVPYHYKIYDDNYIRCKIWYKNNNISRNTGHTIEKYVINTTICEKNLKEDYYYFNHHTHLLYVNKNILHRLDGPAFIIKNRYKTNLEGYMYNGYIITEDTLFSNNHELPKDILFSYVKFFIPKIKQKYPELYTSYLKYISTDLFD